MLKKGFYLFTNKRKSKFTSDKEIQSLFVLVQSLYNLKDIQQGEYIGKTIKKLQHLFHIKLFYKFSSK